MESNNLVLMEALAEVTAVMRDGVELRFSEETGKVQTIPFSEMDREGKTGLLGYGIDWAEYINCGMDPIESDRIIMNAIDGKPQEQWLEPIANEEQWIAEQDAKAHGGSDRIRTSIADRESCLGPTLARLLESYASREPACVEIERGRDR